MKRKRKINTPRRKRLNRSRRLQVANRWMTEYKGKNLIKGYSRRFGVSKLCAAIELQMSGLELPSGTIERLQRLEQELGKARQAKRQKWQAQDCLVPCSREFSLNYLELSMLVTRNRKRNTNARRHAPVKTLSRPWEEELPF